MFPRPLATIKMLTRVKVIKVLAPFFVFFYNCVAQDLILFAYLGKSFPASTYLKVSQDINQTFLRFDGVKLSDKSFEFPLYYGLRITYRLKFVNPRTFVEFEFIHSKVYSDPEQAVKVAGIYRDSLINSVIRFGDIVQNFSISHGLNYGILNFGYKFDLKPYISPFLKFGFGVSIPHFETTIDSLSFERYEVNDFVVQLSCGIDFRVYRGIFGMVELKYTSGEIVNAGIYGGTAETFIKMFHFVFGFGYSF